MTRTLHAIDAPALGTRQQARARSTSVGIRLDSESPEATLCERVVVPFGNNMDRRVRWQRR